MKSRAPVEKRRITRPLHRTASAAGEGEIRYAPADPSPRAREPPCEDSMPTENGSFTNKKKWLSLLVIDLLGCRNEQEGWES